MKLFSGGIALLCAASMLTGCTPKQDGGTAPGGAPKPGATASGGGGSSQNFPGAPSYKVITNGISPFWDPMIKGVHDVSAELKVNGDWAAPSQATNNDQIRVFDDAVASKVDGIAVSAIEADALAPTIDKAVDVGTPVITFDSDSPKSKRAAYIGTDNYNAGKILGAEAVKLLPTGGNLVAFVGNMGAQNARERYQGFQDAVKGHNINFLEEPRTDDKKNNIARSNVEDMITKYGDKINGFVGLYSYNGPAIVEAVKTAGIRNKVRVICFDGDPATLRGLANGDVDVTVVQKPYQFGRLAIMLLNLLHQGKKPADAIDALKPELDKLNMKANGVNIDTGVTVITPANAKEFIQKLKEMGLKST